MNPIIRYHRFVAGFGLAMMLLFSGCSLLYPSKTNQLDEAGRKTGRWISYSSEEPRRKTSDGHFKNGREYRRFKYYHANGKRQVRFVYGRNHRYGESHIKVKYWYPTGKVMQKGTSLMFLDDKEIRYVYDGMWRFYDERGRLIEKTIYRMGEPVSVKLFNQPDTSSHKNGN